MPLLKVLDLTNAPMPVRVDIRSRDAEGDLLYPTQSENQQPIITNLTRVEVLTKKGKDWLYWHWEPVKRGYTYDCGYSGVQMDGEREHLYHVEAAQ